MADNIDNSTGGSPPLGGTTGSVSEPGVSATSNAEPSAPSGGASAEPVSGTTSEPSSITAGETSTPTPPTLTASTPGSFPSADEYGWDTWDGAGTGLPENVQPWFAKFNDRWTEASDRAVTEHTQALQAQRTQAEQYQRMYEHLATGIGDDPRIAEFETQVADMQAQLDAAGSKYSEYETQVDTHMEAEAGRYIKWVQDQYGELLKAGTANAESEARVYQLMGGDGDDDGLELHNALQVHAAGPDAYTAALTMLKDNVPEAYIMQLIGSKYGTSPKPKLAAPRSSSQVVTGAAPSQTPPAPRAKAQSEMTISERRTLAARKAMARDRR